MTCHLSILKPCLASINSKSCKHLPSVPTPSMIHTNTHTCDPQVTVTSFVQTEEINIALCCLYLPLPSYILQTKFPFPLWPNGICNYEKKTNKRSLNASPVKKLLCTTYISQHTLGCLHKLEQWALHKVLHCWFGAGPRVQSPVDPQVRSWLQDWKSLWQITSIHVVCKYTCHSIFYYLGNMQLKQTSFTSDIYI